MKDYIEERVLELAAYVLETQTTVRGAAKHFKISKSTVHKDLTERLTELNPTLAKDVKHVLDNNIFSNATFKVSTVCSISAFVLRMLSPATGCLSSSR